MKKLLFTLTVLFSILVPVLAMGPEPGHLMGKEYYILDEPINVRDEPGMGGNKIDKLYVGEKIKVLGFGEHEALDGDRDFYWTNIEFHNGKTGWIYGKYIATNTIVCDFDQNGTKDYVFFRQRNNYILYFGYPKDVIVYMNGKMLKMPPLPDEENEANRAMDGTVTFYSSQKKDKVLIVLNDKSDLFDNPNGKLRITFLLGTKNGVQFIKNFDDKDCLIKDSWGSPTDELLTSYVEPYLGKNYTFCE